MPYIYGPCIRRVIPCYGKWATRNSILVPLLLALIACSIRNEDDHVYQPICDCCYATNINSYGWLRLPTNQGLLLRYQHKLPAGFVYQPICDCCYTTNIIFRLTSSTNQSTTADNTNINLWMITSTNKCATAVTVVTTVVVTTACWYPR